VNQVQHDQGSRRLERRLRQSCRYGPVNRNHVGQARARIDKGRFAQKGVLTAQLPDRAGHARAQPTQFGKLHVAKVCLAVTARIVEIKIEAIKRFAKAGCCEIGNAARTRQGHNDLDHQNHRGIWQFGKMQVHEKDAVTDLYRQQDRKDDQRHGNARHAREGRNGHGAENPAEESLLVQALIRFPGAVTAVPEQIFSEYV